MTGTRKNEKWDWIPCNVREPEEPDKKAIEDEFMDPPEYLVTIKGAKEATALYYLGNGIWEDGINQRYEVIAWANKPAPYREREK